MAMGGKKSWRKAGRTRKSVVEHNKRRRARTKQDSRKYDYHMSQMQPCSRPTNVVWQRLGPWSGQHWRVVPYNALTADRGGLYAPW